MKIMPETFNRKNNYRRQILHIYGVASSAVLWADLAFSLRALNITYALYIRPRI